MGGHLIEWEFPEVFSAFICVRWIWIAVDMSLINPVSKSAVDQEVTFLTCVPSSALCLSLFCYGFVWSPYQWGSMSVKSS